MVEDVKLRLRKMLGIALIVLGCLGLILPILPGWWVIVIGVEILGFRLVFDRKLPWREMIKLKMKSAKLEEVDDK